MGTAKSASITNMESYTQVINPSGKFFARERVLMETMELATGDIDASDIIVLAAIPSNARIKEILLSNDDLDSNGSPTLAVDVGLYTVDKDFNLTAADVDVYADGITQFQAAAGFTDVAFSARNRDKNGQRVWEDAGATSDPGGVYYLAVTVATGAATAAAGTLSWQITLSQPD